MKLLLLLIVLSLPRNASAMSPAFAALLTAQQTLFSTFDDGTLQSWTAGDAGTAVSTTQSHSASYSVKLSGDSSLNTLSKAAGNGTVTLWYYIDTDGSGSWDVFTFEGTAITPSASDAWVQWTGTVSDGTFNIQYNSATSNNDHLYIDDIRIPSP